MKRILVGLALLTMCVQAQSIHSNAPTPGSGDLSDIAKKTQDPTADLISVPFQSNFYFGVGPGDDTQFVLNIQPVIPIHLNDHWKLLTRTVLPLIDEPLPNGKDLFGLGDTTLTTWLSPINEGSPWTFGFGPIFQLPTATDYRLGSGQWGIGPSIVVVHKSGPWVIGALASNVFSVGGWSDENVNLFTLQPFINYNLKDGWAIGFSPTITADWNSPNDERWTIPIGLGISKVQKVGALPMKFGVSGYYNIEKPANGPDWQLQLQVTFILPE